MLENVAVIFENKDIMMKRLKKAGYEKFMESFRNEHGHFFTEMTEYISAAESADVAAKEVADIFTTETKKNAKKFLGRIWGREQADNNLFMVFYVFPAILLTEDSNAELLCKAICKSWERTFPGNKIGYTTYEALLPKFREKIFGIF